MTSKRPNQPLRKILVALSSIATVSSTVACVIYWMCLIFMNNNQDAHTPTWAVWGPRNVFATLAIWLVVLIASFWIKAEDRRSIQVRQIITFVMLLLLFVAPLFAQPHLARKSVAVMPPVISLPC
jgi:hypothetical protein